MYQSLHCSKIQFFYTFAQCFNITQNVALELLNVVIFHQFLTY